MPFLPFKPQRSQEVSFTSPHPRVACSTDVAPKSSLSGVFLKEEEEGARRRDMATWRSRHKQASVPSFMANDLFAVCVRSLVLKSLSKPLPHGDSLAQCVLATFYVSSGEQLDESFVGMFN